MKTALPPEVEKCRTSPNPGEGCFGIFKLICPTTGRGLFVIASDGRDWQDHFPECPQVWEHVSISSRFGTPIWDEMKWVKTLFWDETETVLQFHPPEAEYVNVNENVLHLWRCAGVNHQTPPKEAV